MKEIIKSSKLLVYDSESQLPEQWNNLLKLAHKATENSYAPYSEFNVGCALLLNNNEIILGSNQENIAYPSGLCAERVAIFYAGSKYPNIAVKAIAITAHAAKYLVSEPVLSCGACLQSISEYETKFKQPITFILQGEKGQVYVAESTSVFLPFQFNVNELRG